MDKLYHILNGDSLKERFPKELQGEIIVMRECLMDGDVKSQNLEEFYNVRAEFITELHGDMSVAHYFEHSVSEFEKIRSLPTGWSIYLWFEDDLFCQVNFWFVAHLLVNNAKECEVFLVRPKNHTQFGFAGLNNSDLKEVFKESIPLGKLEKIALLWPSFQNDNTQQLHDLSKELESSYPFILNAVEAHIARIPTPNHPGRPVKSLLDIMKELKTEEFAPVFREFNKREAIYGYGDLQVKRLFDQIKNSH